jgi:hypothetical protein
VGRFTGHSLDQPVTSSHAEAGICLTARWVDIQFEWGTTYGTLLVEDCNGIAPSCRRRIVGSVRAVAIINYLAEEAHTTRTAHIDVELCPAFCNGHAQVVLGLDVIGAVLSRKD